VHILCCTDLNCHKILWGTGGLNSAILLSDKRDGRQRYSIRAFAFIRLTQLGVFRTLGAPQNLMSKRTFESGHPLATHHGFSPCLSLVRCDSFQNAECLINAGKRQQENAKLCNSLFRIHAKRLTFNFVFETFLLLISARLFHYGRHMKVGDIVRISGEDHQVILVNYTRARVRALVREEKSVTDRVSGKTATFLASAQEFDISTGSECPIVGFQAYEPEKERKRERGPRVDAALQKRIAAGKANK
jgi:hypothetical protein